jgi:hypothetical protein
MLGAAMPRGMIVGRALMSGEFLPLGSAAGNLTRPTKKTGAKARPLTPARLPAMKALHGGAATIVQRKV